MLTSVDKCSKSGETSVEMARKRSESVKTSPKNTENDRTVSKSVKNHRKVSRSAENRKSTENSNRKTMTISIYGFKWNIVSFFASQLGCATKTRAPFGRSLGLDKKREPRLVTRI